jgi:hypothetical protein
MPMFRHEPTRLTVYPPFSMIPRGRNLHHRHLLQET